MTHTHTLDLDLDVHQDSSAVASVAHDHGAEVTDRGTMGTRPWDSEPRIRPLQSTCPPLVLVYEAGPCGYGLSRDLTNKRSEGWVVAPSVIPTKAGDRVTTDRRDAGPRARRLRSGELTPVEVPPVDAEAIRALSRAREDTIRALKAATCRRHALLRRHDRR